MVVSEYFEYVIWKKELKEMTDDDVYVEKVEVGKTVDVTVTVMRRFLAMLPKWFV
jgi:hypothetical protein